MTDFLTPLLVCGVLAIVAAAIYGFAYNRGYDHAWTDSVDQKLNADTCRICGGSNAAGDHDTDCPHHPVYDMLENQHG